jgi:hypothetical protein
MNALRRTTIYAAVLGATLAVLPVTAAEVSPALKQNADLLKTILHTAFKDDSASRLSSLQYSYLTGQGLLFQANAAQGGQYGFYFRSTGANGAPVPPLPPQPPLPNGNLEFDAEEIERIAEAAHDMAEQMQQQHHHSYRVAEQQRAIERELRDVERETREIEFNKTLSKLDKEQQQELEKLKQKAKLLQEKQAQVAKEAALSRKQLEEQRNKQLAEQQQQTAAMIKSVGEKFSQLLCDYGASLRDLPDTEYVSLQVNSRGADGRYYWVIKKADINQCMSGKIKAKDLLVKAKTYQF